MNHDDVALDTRTPTTLLLSAETPAALDQATQDLAAWVTEACKSGHAAWPLPEVAAALRDRLRPLAHRRAVRVESWQDALAAGSGQRQESRMARGFAQHSNRS